MKITALTQIIGWDAEDHRAVIINAGETDDVSEPFGHAQAEAGAASCVGDLPQLDHDGDGYPGGSVAATGDDLPALRARYEEVVGKRPFPGWHADELSRRIATAIEASAVADEIGGEGDAPVA